MKIILALDFQRSPVEGLCFTYVEGAVWFEEALFYFGGSSPAIVLGKF